MNKNDVVHTIISSGDAVLVEHLFETKTYFSSSAFVKAKFQKELINQQTICKVLFKPNVNE